jgi:hypothetical protein
VGPPPHADFGASARFFPSRGGLRRRDGCAKHPPGAHPRRGVISASHDVTATRRVAGGWSRDESLRAPLPVRISAPPACCSC